MPEFEKMLVGFYYKLMDFQVFQNKEMQDMVSILSNAKTPYHLASKPRMTLNILALSKSGRLCLWFNVPLLQPNTWLVYICMLCTPPLYRPTHTSWAINAS